MLLVTKLNLHYVLQGVQTLTFVLLGLLEQMPSLGKAVELANLHFMLQAYMHC